ncbi:MAG: ATP-binding cassette domain-containing protein [Atopobiaceae bacterium]|nr:ATP-binding cassette domain-containing protein [Atopobiaceae bacterium]
MESQIETRSRLDAISTERAYADLASSVSPDSRKPPITLDDVEQVDGAARACLKYMGIEPGIVPEGIEEVHERLEWLCRPTGTMRREVRLDEGWHVRAFGALLGHLDTGETIALIPRGFRGYSYLDPTTGTRVRVTKQVAQRIVPEAILFYRPFPAKACSTSDILSFVVHVFDKSDYLFMVLMTLAVSVAGLVPAWANQLAFGVVAPSGQVGLILPIAALLLGGAIATVLMQAAKNLVMQRVSIKLNVFTQAATFSRILALPSSFFKDYSSGDLATRVNTVAMLTQQLVSMVLGSSLSAIFSLIYIFQIGAYVPDLALPALAIVIVQALLTISSTIATVRYERQTMKASAKQSGVETALLNGIQKIKLSGAEDRAFAKWAHGYAEYARPAYNRPALVRALPALVTLVTLFGTILIYYLAATHHVSSANFMAFNVAFGQVTVAIMAVATVAGQAGQIRPMLEMISPIMEATPETAADKPSVQSLTGAIEMSGVAFRYEDSEDYVLKDLNLKIRSGEYVALVGGSGCGKSTIMRLLLGFEVPERGTIMYGPHDVTKVDLRSLRQHIGVVMQDGQLFMGDIASNITISSPSATLDDAWEAAELAGIADDIRKMPMGMQTIVTEGGGGVSGGQRQRIMIARAICGKRRILMFDEATSALDNVTQKHVSDSLDLLKCTRIVVAHRLSTVRHCDRILVVDDGRIAEEGTYEELIEKDGLFADLVKRQRLDI